MPVPVKPAAGVAVIRRKRRFPRLPRPPGTFRYVSCNDTLDVLRRLGEGRRSGGCGMPTVAVEGRFRFVVNTMENAFEPPHVHLWVGNEDVCRIELNGGTYMDQPPLGNFRDIM